MATDHNRNALLIQLAHQLGKRASDQALGLIFDATKAGYDARDKRDECECGWHQVEAGPSREPYRSSKRVWMLTSE